MRKCAAGLGVAAIAISGSIARAQDIKPDPHTACYFRPQAPACETLIRGQDDSPAAEGVKASYQAYGRYLKNPSGGLTIQDRTYLKDNDIALPEMLGPANQSGLHAVINDPALAGDPDTRRHAVNNFLRHAVAAELYCGFNICEA